MPNNTFNLTNVKIKSSADALECWKNSTSSNQNENLSLHFNLFYGSWNALHTNHQQEENTLVNLSESIIDILNKNVDNFPCSPSEISIFINSILVDASDASLNICITGNGIGFGCPSSLPSLSLFLNGKYSNTFTNDTKHSIAIEPAYLLSLSLSDNKQVMKMKNQMRQNLQDELTVIFSQMTLTTNEDNQYMESSSPKQIKMESSNKIITSTIEEREVKKLQQQELVQQKEDNAIRIFIAGGRSQVGKSSICMGLLGSFLASPYNYEPSSIAYIKPATQCEATQLVAMYCQKHGIEAVPIGPIVYYKGFTREYLAGNVESLETMLNNVSKRVDELCVGKKVVIIDGVGYPAVGSICGTCNATMAHACGYTKSKLNGNQRIPVPVLLIGKSGVGDAVDSYNINASYFKYKEVTVLGGIFNRLSVDGYYSLENCKKAVMQYFDQYKEQEKAFGFIPEVPSISKTREKNESNVPNNESKLNDNDTHLDGAYEFVKVFQKNVDVDSIFNAAVSYRERAFQSSPSKRSFGTISFKPQKTIRDKYEQSSKKIILTREQIETAAKEAGAAAG